MPIADKRPQQRCLFEVHSVFLSLIYLLISYKEFPNDKDNERLKQEFGGKISEYQDGHVVDESIDVIIHEYTRGSSVV